MNEVVVKLITDRIDSIDKKVDDVAKDVKGLLSIKWQVIGGALVASVFIGILTQFALAWAK